MMKCNSLGILLCLVMTAVMLAVVHAANGEGQQSTAKMRALKIHFESELTTTAHSKEKLLSDETVKQELVLSILPKAAKGRETEWEIQIERLKFSHKGAIQTKIDTAGKPEENAFDIQPMKKKFETTRIQAFRKDDGSIRFVDYPKELIVGAQDLDLEAVTLLRALILEENVLHLVRYAAYAPPANAKKGDIFKSPLPNDLGLGSPGSTQAQMEYRVAKSDEKLFEIAIVPSFKSVAAKKKPDEVISLISGNVKVKEFNGHIRFDRLANCVTSVNNSYVVEGAWIADLPAGEVTITALQKYRVRVSPQK